MDHDGAFLLDRLSSAADEINDSEDERRNHEDLLGLAQTVLDPSTPSGEAQLDSLGMDMPRILAKFAVSSHGPCREKALSILKSLAMFCDPRDMFAAYMEALNLYSEPETLALCISLLDDLPQIFTRMRRRRLEFFQESLSGLLRIYSLAVDTGARGQEIFVKLAHIIMAVHGISECEEVAQKRQRLQQTLGIFILLLLGRGCDNVIGDALQPTVLELINLLPECGFSYLDMITGNYLENVMDCIDEEACNSKSQLWDTKRGAVLAVCWSFCGTEATTDQGQLESFLENLCSSTDAFMKSLSNVSLLLTSISTSPKTVELCIDFLATILESSTTKNLFDSEHWLLEQNDFFRLKDFLQAIQSVMIFSPHSKTRQHAYNVLVQTIRQVPPPVARYEMLKLLIMESNQSSMVSLLIYIVKEEVEKAISSKNDPDVAKCVKLESPFASRKVLELVEFVLRPPSGGPPDLPNQIDAVLSVLNLYRFILIKETSGKTNYTGILRKENLEQARVKWLEPFRVFLQGYQLNLQSGNSESDMYAQFSVANVEGVLYRCLELVEEAVKHKSS